MKKLGIIAMTFALLLGMSQCKKEKADTPANEGVKVSITLNVNGNGSRVAVNTENGVVTFENGDLLYVASNGVFVGTLSYDGTNFCGEIIEPTEGQKLQFYFLGNVTPAETMTEGSTTGCSVVISDQTEHLPVISYAPSRENYQIGKTDYNATLLNKCALVKFDVTSVVPDLATCLMGMNNKVTIDFTDNSFAYSQEGEGIITLPEGEGDHWAILLPQDEVVDTEANSSDGIWTGTCGSVPAISENDYLTEGIVIAISHPKGAINSLFTINANGEQVYFSQGNLQYQASTNTWQFAEHQYDYVGNANNAISPNNSGWIDLFGWGTSGYNHGANCYQPWSTSSNYRDYWAYGQSNYNLYDGNGQADWGYNAISNGGNIENEGWRTFTISEWYYIITGRTTASDIRYAKAMVDNVNGVILLPDNWETSTYPLNSTNNYQALYTSNAISAIDWVNILEANGAVFLPASGQRRYNNGVVVESVNNTGRYWASNTYSGNMTRFISFTNTSGPSIPIAGADRSFGQSVRLVRNAE